LDERAQKHVRVLAEYMVAGFEDKRTWEIAFSNPTLAAASAQREKYIELSKTKMRELAAASRTNEKAAREIVSNTAMALLSHFAHLMEQVEPIEALWE
jgi:hypothetical protein